MKSICLIAFSVLLITDSIWGKDFSFESLDGSEDSPQQIGELELDVEVAEQTPSDAQRAPEMLVVKNVRLVSVTKH